MTRTIVDLPEESMRRLDFMAKREGVPRAELIRRGIQVLLAEQSLDEQAALYEFCTLFQGDKAAFEGLSGLDFEQKIRSDWAVRPMGEGTMGATLSGLHDTPQKPYKA